MYLGVEPISPLNSDKDTGGRKDGTPVGTLTPNLFAVTAMSPLADGRILSSGLHGILSLAFVPLRGYSFHVCVSTLPTPS